MKAVVMMKGSKDEIQKIAANWISPEEKRVIEIGCNNGHFSNLLEKKRISNYIGIDEDVDNIKEARLSHPKYKFFCAEITNNLHFLTKASLIVSLQYFQYIEDDLTILNNILPKTKLIISVPNSPYKEYYFRWFELKGWTKRFSPFMDFKKVISIQVPRKPKKKIFLFRGVRNDFIDKKTLEVFRDVTFDNMMFNRNIERNS